MKTKVFKVVFEQRCQKYCSHGYFKDTSVLIN